MDKIETPEEFAQQVEKAIVHQYQQSSNGRGGLMIISKDYIPAGKLIAARDAAIRAECAPKWISVKERLPEAERTVFVRVFPESQYMKPYTTNACYIPPKTVLAENFLDENSDGLADEYDESNDCYWVKEGWFEICMEGEYNYKINGTITHWMPLPEPPKEQQ
jgi:hypothetical protein